MSYSGPGGTPLKDEKTYEPCTAWLEKPGSGPVRRSCVLAAGHYREGDHDSWHTDCPDRAGSLHVGDDGNGAHDHLGYLTCLVWGDHASGAHPAGEMVPDCRCVRVHGKITCQGTCPEAWAMREPARPATEENRPGRTLTDLPTYTVSARAGGMEINAQGTAAVVAAMLHAFADAFETEADR
jgi:hypothetical protein